MRNGHLAFYPGGDHSLSPAAFRPSKTKWVLHSHLSGLIRTRDPVNVFVAEVPYHAASYYNQSVYEYFHE